MWSRINDCIEPVQRGSVRKSPAVGPREILQTGAHLLATAWLIHQLGELRPVPKIDSVRRHGTASSQPSGRDRMTWRSHAARFAIAA